VILLLDVLLIYPFFKSRFDNSPFRFAPLGIGYIASVLRHEGLSVSVLDCTFQDRRGVVKKIGSLCPRIVGIYSMYSMEDEALQLARRIRKMAGLLVAGGPLPTVEPSRYLDDFDVVIVGEAERTMLDLAKKFLANQDFKDVHGIVFKDGSSIHQTPVRKRIEDLDSVPFPARDLFENNSYKKYYRTRFGYGMASMISSRGCPFECDFCSRPVFGESLRSRSPANIVDEIELIVSLGYDTVWFADDCFTISKDHVMKICDELIHRGVKVGWQCLSRVDALDFKMAKRMKEAGCQRIYFGIESGDERTLKTMRKHIDLASARTAVENANSAGIQTGAFFILGYPGEDDAAILNTVRFATNLPLDYLSFTFPYPIPGTGLHSRVKNAMRDHSSHRSRLISHSLTYNSEFSELKLKFAISKATIQYEIRKYLGEKWYRILGRPFERITDSVFKKMS
jgi:anaerobic magnesium-protoporphyrin IX monomethyl ester cyclase